MVLMKLWTLRKRPASQLKHALSQEWKQWSGIRDLVKVSKALQNHYNLFKVSYKSTRTMSEICSKSATKKLEQCMKYEIGSKLRINTLE